jgi:hypothetical protein
MELCDRDLANIILPWEEYNCWCELALAEAKILYPSLNRKELLRGQASFCSSMLERERIYYRHPEWEDLARCRLEDKIEDLETLIDADTG